MVLRGSKRKFYSDGSVRTHKNQKTDRGYPRRTKGYGDWSLPGTNYIGPGNPVDRHPPLSSDDAIARDHDMAYSDYIAQGQDPYWSYSKADERARKKFGKTWQGKLGHAFFTAKRFAWKAGFIRHLKEGPKHRIKPSLSHHSVPAPRTLTSQFAAMSTTQGNNPHKAGQETPVDNIPVTRFHPFDDTTQVYMPYYTGLVLTPSIVLGTPPQPTGAFTLRLNSIQDIVMSTANVSINNNKAGQTATTADIADNQPNQPKCRDFYSRLYNFYSVVRTKVKIKAFYVGGNPFHEYNVYCYVHDADAPPGSSNGTETVMVPHHFRKFHPGCIYKTLRPGAMIYNGSTGNYAQAEPYASTISFDIDWKPGCIPGVVAQDEFQNAWTAYGQTPALMQHLSVIVQPTDRMVTFKDNNAINAGAGGICPPVYFEVEVGLTVQLKDLKPTLKYADPTLKMGTYFPADTGIYSQRN